MQSRSGVCDSSIIGTCCARTACAPNRVGLETEVEKGIRQWDPGNLFRLNQTFHQSERSSDLGTQLQLQVAGFVEDAPQCEREPGFGALA
jgi:hypothetical protein